MSDTLLTDVIIEALNEELGKYKLCSFVVTQSSPLWNDISTLCFRAGKPIKATSVLRIIPTDDGALSSYTYIIAHVIDAKMHVLFFRARHTPLIDTINLDDPKFIDQLLDLCLLRFPSFGSTYE